MLDELERTIYALKRRIRDHRHYYSVGRSGKWRTRMGLVSPLLTAIGWDTADPELVHLDYRTANGWADFALLENDGRPLALVEAKNLGGGVDATLQLLSDAMRENEKTENRVNIRYCVWTNGDRWMLYNVNGSDSCGLMTSFDFSSNDIGETERAFVYLAKTLDNSGSVTLPADGITETSRPEQILPISMDWVPLTEVTDPTGRDGPTRIKFPQGEVVYTSTWKGLLIEIVRYLHESGGLTEATRRYWEYTQRPLIRVAEGAHVWERFMSPVLVEGTDIILETKFSAEQITRHAATLLYMHKVEPSSIHLKFERIPGNRRSRSRNAWRS